MRSFELDRSGFRSHAELADWLDFLAWDGDPAADPTRYRYEPDYGWVPAVRASQVLPWINALADLLVLDLLRVRPQTT